jgi:MOSC domain-containing protein YiiM
MNLVFLNVGLPKTVSYGQKSVYTAGLKTPVSEALLHDLGLAGDGQADLDNHGGPDKAVCVYSYDHYPYWETWSGAPLRPGAFSENFTVAGLSETEVCIGDEFQAGQARVQISQPRAPCAKLAGKWGRRDIQPAIHANGYTGFYFRVLAGGLVRAGDALIRVSRHPAGLTVAFANEVWYKQRADPASLQRLLGVAELSAAWRESLSQRI